MPDVSYVITIKNETGDGAPGTSTKNIVTPTPNNGGKNAKEESYGILKTKESKAAYLKGVAVYATVKSFATQIISHEVSTVELRTGSSEAQQVATAWYNGINRGVGVLEKVTTGAMIGSTAGPIGGVIGAAAGLAVGVIHEAVSIRQNIIDIALNAALENTSIRLNYIRAGVNGSRQI